MRNSIRRIKKLEKNFSRNYYNGIGKKAFSIIEGTIPIMLSAPHAINQYREGKIKWADMFTGGISKYIQEKTGCHLIYSCKYTESDPNFDPPEINNYQGELLNYLRTHEIFVLIDIHGAAKTKKYAVEMGTVPKKNKETGEIFDEDSSLHSYKFIAEIIKQKFENAFKNVSVEEKEVWKNVIFDASEQNTVTKYISENTKTACIQLEINGIYRDPKNKNEFIELVNCLEEIVKTLSAIEWETFENAKK